MSPSFPAWSSEGSEVSSRFAGFLCATDRLRKAENLYDALNIPETSTKQEIDNALQLAKQPVDPNNQSSSNVDMASYMTSKLYGAHAVLSDDIQRRRYDSLFCSVQNMTTRSSVSRNPREVIVNSIDVERLYRIISTSKEYSRLYYCLFDVFCKIRASEQEWRKCRKNRIYGGSTHYLVNAFGHDYQTYLTNVRARAQQLAISDCRDLSALTTQVQDFRRALSTCYHHQFGTSDTTKTWLTLMWVDTDRISAWINGQRFATKWYIEQVELYLELHIMKAKALHVWPIYQATGNSPPMTAFVPNCLPHLSEAQIIQRIRTTPCHRVGVDRGMRNCCENMCDCQLPRADEVDIPPPPTSTEPNLALSMSLFHAVGKMFKNIKPTANSDR